MPIIPHPSGEPSLPIRIIRFIWKELKLLSQNIIDALARIKDMLSSKSQSILDLRAQIATLMADGTAKDAQIADLKAQLSSLEAQILELAGSDPSGQAAPPADGSNSPDVTP